MLVKILIITDQRSHCRNYSAERVRQAASRILWENLVAHNGNLSSPISLPRVECGCGAGYSASQDRKSTRLNSSHVRISYAVFCLKKKKRHNGPTGYSARVGLSSTPSFDGRS